jgi:hypothetical protein
LVTLAEHAGALRVAPGDVDPGIFAQLLEAQGDAVALAVELEDLDVDLLADFDHDLGRVLDALPGHVGDVQQAVDAAEVDEGAVVGEVLDHALDRPALPAGSPAAPRARRCTRLFDHRAARDDHVVALLVELDDLEFEFLAFEVRGVANRAHIDQGAGQERADRVDVDGEAALDLAVDNMPLTTSSALKAARVLSRPRRAWLSRATAWSRRSRPRPFPGDLHLVADAQGALARSHRELGAGMTPSDLSPACTVTHSLSISITTPVTMEPGCISTVLRLSSKRSANDSLIT